MRYALSAPEPALEGAPKGDYSSMVLRSAPEVLKLCQTKRHWFRRLECSSQPEFFFATLDKNRWAPRVAVVKHSGDIVGFVFLRERTLGGVRTGVLCADTTLSRVVIAEPQNEQAVFLAGIKAVLQESRVNGLRLLVPSKGYEIPLLFGLRAEDALDLEQAPDCRHSVMALEADYEAFLGRLGPRTRRSFRHLPLKSEASNHQFVPNIRIADYQRAADVLLADEVMGADRSSIDLAIRILGAVRQPLLVGLRSERGDWLSVLSGWYELNRVVIFQQLNSDRQHPRDSLSLVMRARVIKMLIEQGCHEVVWWGGVRGPLSYYVHQVPMQRIYVDKRKFLWSIFRRTLRNQHRRLPASLAYNIGWLIRSESFGDLAL